MTATSPGADVLRIGLLWHSTRSSNLGVGALTVANLAIARRAVARLGVTPHFVVIEMLENGAVYIDDADVDRFGIDSRTMLRPGGLWSLMDRLDCVLDIGGGDSFAQIYGPKRFGFLWLSKAMAIVRRTPLLLSPQTIGPFTSFAYRKLATFVMRRADLVVARDPMSFDVIGRLAPRARALKSIDVAFALPFTRPSRPTDDGRLRIGINVSGMLFNESVSGRNRYGLSYDYAQLTRQLLTTLCADDRYAVDLISHVSAPDQPVDDDGQVAALLEREFPSVTVVPTFASPSDAKSYISGLDFLIAGRMHACIAAFSSGIPFTATAYSRKFTGLFGMLGYSATMSWKDLSTSQAFDFIIDALDRRQELRDEIALGARQVDSLLGAYEDALTDFFARVRATA